MHLTVNVFDMDDDEIKGWRLLALFEAYAKGLRPVAANSVSIGRRFKGLALESSPVLGKTVLGL